jgi:hypothetical protein
MDHPIFSIIYFYFNFFHYNRYNAENQVAARAFKQSLIATLGVHRE